MNTLGGKDHRKTYRAPESSVSPRSTVQNVTLFNGEIWENVARSPLHKKNALITEYLILFWIPNF